MYLAELTMRLTEGVSRLQPEVRQQQASFLKTQQREDGGFPGRKGPSDLYYTGFALRALALLDALDRETANRAGRFLASRLSDFIVSEPEGPSQAMSAIEDFSLLTGAMIVEFATGVDLFTPRAIDPLAAFGQRIALLWRDQAGLGGYAKSPRGSISTYQTFLTLAARESIGIEPTDTERESILAMVHAMRREDGGFAEITAIRRSGTNPTAAAIGILRMLDGLRGPSGQRIAGEAIDLILSMRGEDGGFLAAAHAPVSDLLSTFTALTALRDLASAPGRKTTIHWAKIQEATEPFIRSCVAPSGGFSAGPWDETPDVEYTFYGIGALATLVLCQ